MFTSGEEPVHLLNQAGVARKLGVGRSAVANYLVRYPDEVPKPVAYLEDGERGLVPLWREEQLPAWQSLMTQRRERQAVQRTLETLEREARRLGVTVEALLEAATSSRPGSSSSDPEPKPSS